MIFCFKYTNQTNIAIVLNRWSLRYIETLEKKSFKLMEDKNGAYKMLCYGSNCTLYAL